MQQTSKYKLNLIEKTDTFSPDPLNENARKLEAQLIQADGALASETAARTAADAAEAKARADAVTAETNARTAAVNAEARARTDADSAETAARIAAVNAEANTRSAADTAEANARSAADTAEANTRAAADTALDSRITTLEAHKIVVGSYQGNGAEWRTISLGFTPKAVFVKFASNRDSLSALAVTNGNASEARIVANGFQVNERCNYNNYLYNYFAIL